LAVSQASEITDQWAQKICGIGECVSRSSTGVAHESWLPQEPDGVVHCDGAWGSTSGGRRRWPNDHRSPEV